MNLGQLLGGLRTAECAHRAPRPAHGQWQDPCPSPRQTLCHFCNTSAHQVITALEACAARGLLERWSAGEGARALACWMAGVQPRRSPAHRPCLSQVAGTARKHTCQHVRLQGCRSSIRACRGAASETTQNVLHDGGDGGPATIIFAPPAGWELLGPLGGQAW